MLKSRIGNFFKEQFDAVARINGKYSKPRIKMTRMVAVSLFFLQVYLLFLVGVLFYKFWTMLK